MSAAGLLQRLQQLGKPGVERLVQHGLVHLSHSPTKALACRCIKDGRILTEAAPLLPLIVGH